MSMVQHVRLDSSVSAVSTSAAVNTPTAVIPCLANVFVNLAGSDPLAVKVSIHPSY